MTEHSQPDDGLSRAALGALLGLLDAGVLLLDANLRVAYANRALVSLLGLGVDPHLLIGTPLPAGPAAYSHAYQEPRRARARIEATMRHARPARGERYPMSEGRLISHDYTPVTLEGSTAGHLWVLREPPTTTAETHELREGVALASGERDLLIAIAHELRTPTASVAAAVELLDVATQVPSPPGEEERTWATHTVRRNTQRMVRLADDLILLADLRTAETGPAGDSAVDLRELVLDAVAACPHSTQATVGAPGTRPDAPTDPARLTGDLPLLRRAVDTAIAIAAALGTRDEPVRISAAPARGGWSVTVSTPVTDPVTTERMITTMIPEREDLDCSRSAALALLLARAIIARHGGLLTVPTTASDFVITLSLPTHL
jgi:signal transduction histidine kinase